MFAAGGEAPESVIPSPVKGEEGGPPGRTAGVEVVAHGFALQRILIFLKLGLPGEAGNPADADVLAPATLCSTHHASKTPRVLVSLSQPWFKGSKVFDSSLSWENACLSHWC